MEISKIITKRVRQTKKSIFRPTAIFSILSNTNCFRIFSSLVKYDKLTSQDIAVALKISRSLATRYLTKLESNHILTKRIDGRELYYYLNHENPQVAAVESLF